MNLVNNLKRGIVYVLIANTLNMIFNLITNFLLPKYLSVDVYAAIKTFQLYVNYIGALHLGYIDGIYLKYGGKDISQISSEDMAISLSTLRILEFVVTVGGLGISVIFHDTILFAFSLAVLPLNMISYFRMLFQAIGEFEIYGRITNLMSALTFFANIILLFVYKNNNYGTYLLTYVMVDALIWIALEIYFCKTSSKNVKLLSLSFCELRLNVKNGFSLMCGNFASFILTGMDRWFVKLLMNNIAFAQYSFAVSIENMLNMIITPVTIPLYNYFCIEKSDEKINYALKAVVVFSIYLISAAFVVELPVELFLNNYLSSMRVVFLLFAAQAFQIIIKAIYVNLYKVQKRQSCYLIKLVLILISGFIFNTVCYQFMHTKEAFAWGTLFSASLWFVITLPDFHNIKWPVKDMLCFNLSLLTFVVCGFYLNAITGFIIYVVIASILIVFLMNEFAISLIKKGYYMLFKR